MSASSNSITIRCRNCGQMLYISFMQHFSNFDEDEYVRFRCGCGTDIDVLKNDLIAMSFTKQLRDKWPALFKMLVMDLYGDKEEAENYGLDTQLEQIPNVCKHFKCVFEIEEATSKANYKRMKEWKEECPKICPKWRAKYND